MIKYELYPSGYKGDNQMTEKTKDFFADLFIWSIFGLMMVSMVISMKNNNGNTWNPSVAELMMYYQAFSR
jgi:hypothetical protein